jgi:hypothetical protein
VGVGTSSVESRPPIRSPEEVGSTIVSGVPPVEPTSGVGVGASSVESRPPIRPSDEVGCRTLSGTPPVDPGTMKGPRMLDAPAEEGAVEVAGDAVGMTMVSGIPPVEATFWPEDTETSEDAPCVAWTTVEGTPPVDPIKGLRSEERRPPTSPVEAAEGVSVGRTTTGGMPPVEPTAEEDGWTMTSGIPPVEAGVCSVPGGVEL